MEKQQKKSNKKRIWDIIVYSFAGLLILLGAGLLISENVVFSDYSPPPTMPAQTPHITPDTSETALPSTAPEPTVTPEPTPAAAPMYICIKSQRNITEWKKLLSSLPGEQQLFIVRLAVHISSG